MKNDSDSAVTGSAGQLSNWVLCIHYVPLPLPPGCPSMCEEVCALNSQPEEENTEVHKRNLSSPDGMCVCVCMCMFQENVTKWTKGNIVKVLPFFHTTTLPLPHMFLSSQDASIVHYVPIICLLLLH